MVTKASLNTVPEWLDGVAVKQSRAQALLTTAPGMSGCKQLAGSGQQWSALCWSWITECNYGLVTESIHSGVSECDDSESHGHWSTRRDCAHERMRMTQGMRQ
eukprot:1157977-Pelagomonas_calceolata.AAC.9